MIRDAVLPVSSVAGRGGDVVLRTRDIIDFAKGVAKAATVKSVGGQIGDINVIFDDSDVRFDGVVMAATFAEALAIGDQTAKMQATFDRVKARGGGRVTFPLGVVVGLLPPLSRNVVPEGVGRFTCILAPANATRGVVETEYCWEHINLRAQAAIASNGTSIQVPTQVPPTLVGHIILLPLHDNTTGKFAYSGSFRITGISGTTWTFANDRESAPGVPIGPGIDPGYNVPAWSQCNNISAGGPENVALRKISIFGDTAAPPLNNVCAAQAVTSGTNMTFASTLLLGGAVRFSWCANLRLVITTSAVQMGKWVVVTGTQRNKDLTVSTVTETMMLGAAGFYVTDNWFETITSIAPGGSGSWSGTVTVGAGEGQSARNGITLWGQGWRLDDVYVRDTRGWSLRYGFVNTGGGFTSGDNNRYLYQQGSWGRLDLYLGDGGGIWGNGPVDSAGSETYVGYCLGDAFYLQGLSSGSPFLAGHICGGYVGSGVLREPIVGARLESEASGFDAGFKIEGCQKERVMALGNNAVVGDTVRLFDANGKSTSVGVRLGYAARGWGNCQGYRIGGKIDNCRAGAINFDSDGGSGFIDVTGFELTNGPIYIGTPMTGTYASRIRMNIVYATLGGSPAPPIIIDPTLPNYASPALAAAGGILPGQQYRTGNAVMVV